MKRFVSWLSADYKRAMSLAWFLGFAAGGTAMSTGSLFNSEVVSLAVVTSAFTPFHFHLLVIIVCAIIIWGMLLLSCSRQYFYQFLGIAGGDCLGLCLYLMLGAYKAFVLGVGFICLFTLAAGFSFGVYYLKKHNI